MQYKFKEEKYLKEVKKYIDGTYGQHYVTKNNFQALDGIMESGHGEGFIFGNLQKLPARYGKKEGRNRKDILKIIHYGILALYHHDHYGKEE